MADQDPKNARNDQNDDQNDELLDEVDVEAVEDLDVDEEAEDVKGGITLPPCFPSMPPCMTQ